MSSVTELIRDPVFQMNILLWLTQPLPSDSVYKPILREAGFEVYTIARMLAPPVEVLLALKDSNLPHQDSIRPDIILNRSSDRCFILVECKGKSFGVASSTAEQARTFLVLCGPRLHDSLGIKRLDVGTHAASYLVPFSDQKPMRDTLDDLNAELTRNQLPCGTSITLSLQINDATLDLHVEKDSLSLLGLLQQNMPILDLKEVTDPRPLYIIPYDPDCNQSLEEKTFCKRVLFERVHAEILGATGRAKPPVDIPLNPQDLLNNAMFGMYDLWENPESNKNMRAMIREQLVSKMMQAVIAECGEIVTYEKGIGWTIHLADSEIHQKVCNVLSRFSCETLDLRAEPLPSLFDDL